MSPRILALPLAFAAGCARIDPRLVDASIAGRPWVSAEHRSHPLAGKIWEPSGARFVDEAVLTSAVAAADLVALGEVHDNPDHHLLQARLVRAIAATGRKPALAFEMLTTDQQAAVDSALESSSRGPGALAQAWKEARWPDFDYYRPIIAAGLDAHLPIVAANIPRDLVKEIVSKGREALDEETRQRLEREEPIPDDVMAALRKEMNESHCGELPDSMIDPLVLAQRARDARMAERILRAGEGRGAILIAGNGHVRSDRGVPALVSGDAPDKKVLALAFLEVDPQSSEPAAYEEEWRKGPLPFDFVVFTPRTKREDPCERMREHMRKKR